MFHLLLVIHFWFFILQTAEVFLFFYKKQHKGIVNLLNYLCINVNITKPQSINVVV